jgi:hypothetical protein
MHAFMSSFNALWFICNMLIISNVYFVKNKQVFILLKLNTDKIVAGGQCNILTSSRLFHSITLLKF